MKLKLYQQGFTMLEMIITIALLAVGILSVYNAFLPSLKSSYDISRQLPAVYLAQEGIEVIKNIKDSNVLKNLPWSSGLLDCANGCQLDYKTGTDAESFFDQLKPYDDNEPLKIDATGFYSYDPTGQKTMYRRKVIITQPNGSDSLKVNVQVFWNYHNQPFSFETIAYFYDK